jgi:hypothetical protein
VASKLPTVPHLPIARTIGHILGRAKNSRARDAAGGVVGPA